MSTENNNAETRSLHPPARPPEGQILTRPTVRGWWWLKPNDAARWEPIYVYGDNGTLMVDGDDLGDEDGEMREAEAVGGLWAGPLTPPG